MHLHSALIVISVLALSLQTVGPCRAEDANKAAQAPKAAQQAQMAAALKMRSAVGPYTETTTASGKIPENLTGVWLVIANTKPSPKNAPDKVQSYVQLMKVTNADGATPTFHVLDVQLPASIQSAIDKSRAEMSAWKPTAEQLATLKKDWATLPPFKEKTVSQPMYESVEYKLVAADHYKESLAGAPPEVLDGSTYALAVNERYRPVKLPDGVNLAQLMGRYSLYSFKPNSRQADQLNGTAWVKFTAAGGGFPLPLSFNGGVQMIKVADA